MKRFLAALFAACSVGVAAQAAEVGSIHGYILKRPAYASVAGVTVEVRGNGYRRSVETDTRGRFALIGLPPGPATIFVSGDGWIAEAFHWCIRPNESDAIPLWIVNQITVMPYFQGYYNRIEREDALRTTTDQYTVGGC
jgi:hypothetical protein